MRTSHIWWVTGLLAAGGVALQIWGANVDAGTPMEDPWGVLGMILVACPLALALNITLRRRRDDRRESSPDSVEFRAAQLARSQAFTDAVMLACLLFLALAVLVDATAALVAMVFVALVVAAFWIRYRLALRAVGG